jgi:hypothetical protein
MRIELLALTAFARVHTGGHPLTGVMHLMAIAVINPMASATSCRLRQLPLPPMTQR